MKYDLVLAMTCCNRLDYTVSTLESLSTCHGVGDIKLHIFCEPICQDVIKYVKSVDFCETQVHVHPERFGHTKNAHTSLNYCFDKYNDYTILIEDDQLFAFDFLRIHTYFRDTYRDDINVFSASAGHYLGPKLSRDQRYDFTYTYHRSFSNQGWGMWPDRWANVTNDWERYEVVADNQIVKRRYLHRGWDWKMVDVHLRDRHEVVPFLSRVFNIGEHGVHCRPKFYHETVALEDWAIRCNFVKNNKLQFKKYEYGHICLDDGVSPIPETHNLFNQYVKA